MRDQWTAIHESVDLRSCSERALVLTSLDIPSEILRSPEGHALVVPAEYAERAKFELWQYEKENVPLRPQRPRVVPVYQNGAPGVVAYMLVVLAVAWLAGSSVFGRDWLSAGRVDGALMRDGEWWRSITALTLHSGVRHLLGNLGFGALFGFFAGRLAGSGVAWLVILLAGTAGNILNTLLLDATHRSIGASTAIFAALGVLSGYVWRGRLMGQERWPYRFGPIVGGIALLAFTGTGDENTDIGAHLAGFLCGLAAGMALTAVAGRLPDRRLQSACGAAALLSIAGAWLLAFVRSGAA